MKHILLLFFLCLTVGPTRADSLQSLRVIEKTLPNGLTVWLNPDDSQAKIIGYVVVRAGARDCPNTGIAHYFEHIMFKGTQTIGTTDYAKEKPFLDQIARQYDALSRTTDLQQRRHIQQEINQLNRQAAVYAIPNEFSKLLTHYGGSRVNAFTSLDETVYHSEFAPQYLRQWCALNSERFLQPVFRLFQSELETVYEEKNRAADDFGRSLMERAQELIFRGSSYGYPVIGSTENLKNPRLSDMEAFFRKYYVANNMALILCGKFDADSVMPLLEQTFGRIRSGAVPHRADIGLAPFSPKKALSLKIPFPLVKATALVFRGPKPYSPDYLTAQLAMGLLSNRNGSGLVDSLMSHHKLMYAMAAADPITFTKEAGLMGLLAVPRIPFGTKRKAELLLWEQINKLRNGQFSEEALAASKLEYQKELAQRLEKLDRRINAMADVYSGGTSWHAYLQAVERLPQLTKADVVAFCRQYFADQYLVVHKKFGHYKKDRIAKPPYQPVQTADENQSSAFAKQLALLPTQELSPRFVDFQIDVDRATLPPNGMLYTTPNPLNDIFELTLTWHQLHGDKPIHQMNDLFDYLGTTSLGKQAFAKLLQGQGTTLTGSYDYRKMTLRLTGLDHNLEASLRLLSDLLAHPKTEARFMEAARKDARLGDKYFGRDMNDIVTAMLQRIGKGEKALLSYGMRTAELSRLKNADMEMAFKQAQQGRLTACYTGRLSTDSVARMLRRFLPATDRTAYEGDDFDAMPVTTPIVYVYDKPDARQAMVGTYAVLPPLSSTETEAKFTVWQNYFSNGGLNSVLFRELRDLRSLVYSSQGITLKRAHKSSEDKPFAFFTLAGTQTDKAMTTLLLIDSLQTHMPWNEQDLLTARQSCVNAVNNACPNFRERPAYVAGQELCGYTQDPDSALTEAIRRITPVAVRDYYDTSVKVAPRSYFVIGNLKAIDRTALRRLGRVVEWKKEDIR